MYSSRNRRHPNVKKVSYVSDIALLPNFLPADKTVYYVRFNLRILVEWSILKKIMKREERNKLGLK
jgi:hypothetical protein